MSSQVCVRHVPVGHKFLLIRTDEEFIMREIRHKTPSGTEYVVRRVGEMLDTGYRRKMPNTTLHHSCHVVLFGKQ